LSEIRIEQEAAALEAPDTTAVQAANVLVNIDVDGESALDEISKDAKQAVGSLDQTAAEGSRATIRIPEDGRGEAMALSEEVHEWFKAKYGYPFSDAFDVMEPECPVSDDILSFEWVDAENAQLASFLARKTGRVG
jgi:hypothetical protein